MTLAQEITEGLTKWTIENSGHQLERDYIGLSHCALSIEEIVEFRLNGFPVGEDQLRKFYKGYQMEADLLRRLRIRFGDRVQPGGEIVAFGGRVKGHPDFLFDGYPGDCKSVPLNEHIPQRGRLPRRVFWQMQGYMLFAPAQRSVVVYESRETGIIEAFDVFPARGIQEEIHAKVGRVMEILAGTLTTEARGE